MGKRRTFTIGLIQMACCSKPRENLACAMDLIDQAARSGADVICLQELFAWPYFCQCEDSSAFDLAEPVPGHSTRALSKLAKKERVVLVAPIFERRAAGLYHNSAAVIDTDGKILGLYRKMHIPDDPAYYEKFYFAPGDLGFRVFDTRVGRIGTMICWDQWFPEGARLAALRGAQVIFYPTAIGWHPNEKEKLGPKQLDAWKTVQRGHAIANGVYVAVVNRIGHEVMCGRGPGIEFWGSSFVADPSGVVLTEASVSEQEILLSEVDLDHLEEVRRHWPFLRDRRVDAYSGLDQRYLDEARSIDS